MKHVVGGALFNDGRLLVVKRTEDRPVWPGLWEISGGKLEPNENDEQAIKREFQEETNLKIKVVKKYFSFEYDYAGNKAIENDYIVESDNLEIKIDPNEHTEYRWVTRPEVKALKMSPGMRRSVEKVFDEKG